MKITKLTENQMGGGGCYAGRNIVAGLVDKVQCTFSHEVSKTSPKFLNPHGSLRNSTKLAFTLAEVLITLGIIGVVAALTLPAIIAKHQKVKVASKLKKFQSVMEQAILAEEAQIGSREYWLPDNRTQANFKEWFNEHLAKHLKIIYTEDLHETYDFYKVGFEDGSGFIAYHSYDPPSNNKASNRAHFFYCTELKYCGINRFDGQTSFLFSICGDGKFIPSTCGIYYAYDRTRLLDGCKYGNQDNAEESTKDKRHSCARLIQYDGWDIKPDYPWRQTILEKK